METLLIAVVLVLFISGLCSLSEAVLYSVPWSHIEQLRESGKTSGKILYKLRQKVDEPITAILTLNTISHTAGAAIAGAAAVSVFGEGSLIYFSLIFTALILILSEILPKTVGVLYNRFLSSVLARPLQWMVVGLYPIIKALSFFVHFLSRRKGGPETSEEDLLAMVSLTRKSGVLKHFEEESIQNILTLDTKTVREVMTPRTVIFSLSADKTVSEVWEEHKIWPYSRVPVFDNDDPEDIVGIVYRREVLEALASDHYSKPLASLMKSVHFILETLTLDRVLVTFLESRLHLAVVLDEYGGVAGLITLEDVLEEILGKEIMDETDQVADMRKLALERRQRLLHSDL
jgi:CBS domain containing-hemolysin-like protein